MIYIKREYVIEQLEKNKGTQFDSELSDIMVKLIHEGILVEADEYFANQNFQYGVVK